MEIYSFALDIKAGLGRRPSIIEFNALDYSGHTGYSLAGLGDVIKDKIIPDFESAFPDRKVILMSDKEAYVPLYIADENARAIFINNDCVAYRNSILYGRYRQKFWDQATSNCNLTAHSILSNKAVLADLLQRAERMNDHVPSFICPTEYHANLADQAIESIGDHERYIIKPVGSAVGDGVRVIKKKNLNKELKNILVTLRAMDRFIPGMDYWLSDKEPAIIIQPYIPSDPVYKNGQPYDGTMRVFASIHREDRTQPFSVILHDAYWKLPLWSGGDISYSPNCTERADVLKSIFNYFVDTKLKRINSLAVDDTLKNHVFDCLRESLPEMGATLFQQSHKQLIRGYLFSKDPVDQALGVMLATHDEFYLSDSNTFNYSLTPASPVSQSVIKRMKRLAISGAPSLRKSIQAKAETWKKAAEKRFSVSMHPLWLGCYRSICEKPKPKKRTSRFSFLGKMLPFNP